MVMVSGYFSKMVKKVFLDSGVTVLPWPSNSPDMIAIEAIWAIQKYKLCSKTLRRKQDMISKILELCMWQTPEHDELAATCMRLVGSIPTRVEKPYEARRGHTHF